MKASVRQIDAQYSTVNAVTDNDVLIVFSVPRLSDVHIGDELEIDLLHLDEVQTVHNQTCRTTLSVRIQSNDVHDLHLPAGHGTSRFPSVERRQGQT